MPSIPNIVVAHQLTGSTLANKINNAIGSLNGSPGEVWIFGGGNIDIPVITANAQTLRFFSGDYIFSGTGRIFVGSYCTVWGSDWSVRFFERATSRPVVSGEDFLFIASKVARNENGPVTSTYGRVFAQKSIGIHVTGIQFVGIRSNYTDGTTASIGLWNSHYSTVTHCWFNGTTGYAAQIGVGASNLTTALTIGQEYASGVRFQFNVCENLISQQVAVINAAGVSINHNKFINPGKKRITIVSLTPATNPAHTLVTLSENHELWDKDSGSGVNTDAVSIRGVVNSSGSGLSTINAYYSENGGVKSIPSQNSFTIAYDLSGKGTYLANSGSVATLTNNGSVVDLESNNDDALENQYLFDITDNVFDFRDATINTSGISVNIPSGGTGEVGSISRNRFWGINRADPTGKGGLSDAIATHYGGESPGGSGAKKITIDRNIMYSLKGRGLYLSGKDIRAVDNELYECGYENPNPAIMIHDLHYSEVSRNIVKNRFHGSSYIEEKGNNSYNTVEDNDIGDNLSLNDDASIRHRASETIGGTTYTYSSTHTTYRNNRIAKGGYIQESANSDYNIYENNQTGKPSLIPTGISIVGANSKVWSHRYNDGSGIRGANFSPIATASDLTSLVFVTDTVASAANHKKFRLLSGGGVKTVATLVVLTSATNYGAMGISVASGKFTTRDVPPIYPNNDGSNETPAQQAADIRDSLNADSVVTTYYVVGGTGANVTLTGKTEENETSLLINYYRINPPNPTGVTPTTSTITTAGSAPSADDIVQVCIKKANGDYAWKTITLS